MTNSERARKTALKIWANDSDEGQDAIPLILEALIYAVKEKDEEIAELLAALKQYNETIENYVTMENQIPFDDPAYKDDVEIINKVRQITQHKGE